MPPTPDTAAKVRRHLEHSDQYFENSQEALAKNEVSKAGELLWGSVAQVFHALATVRGVDVQRHRRLKNFAIHVSNETEDPPKTIGGFLAAEILHKGFHDVDVERTDLEAGIPLARYTIEAVSNLIPGDLKEPPLHTDRNHSCAH